MLRIIKYRVEPTIRIEIGRRTRCTPGGGIDDWFPNDNGKGFERRWNIELSLYKYPAGSVEMPSGEKWNYSAFKRPLIRFWKGLDDVEMYPCLIASEDDPDCSDKSDDPKDWCWVCLGL